MARVALQGVSKTYPGGIAAVAEVDLEVGDGELFVLVGPSGSGKSTLLRLIAGLEELTAGAIWIGGKRADRLPPRARDLAMVFQHPALYPHLSVAGNLAFGLHARRVPRPEVRTRVAAVAARLGLETVLDRAPRTLSGGQRQRVALGRAIVRQPAAFLLDEPLTSLDAPLRAALRAELVELHRSLGTTMIHVTHDQAEALALGQRIAVMNRGRIAQTGTPLEVYNRPRSRFVAQFVGNPPMNVLPCSLERSDGQVRIRLEGVEALVSGPLTPPPRLKGFARVDLGIRPEGIAVGPVDEDRAPAVLAGPARVRRLEPLGHETIATLELGPHPVQVRLASHATVREGDEVPLRIGLERASWFDPQTGESLEEESEGFTAGVQ